MCNALLGSFERPTNQPDRATDVIGTLHFQQALRYEHGSVTHVHLGNYLLTGQEIQGEVTLPTIAPT